ncbi:MAG TPA: heptaprenyl diphosphate synthase [Lachnospiraceae bacterium]|nr:heptaprenyl diphosphate synthase [Lachnospiraceae bacterium]
MKKKTAYMGLFLAFALILSYVESLIPFYFGVPGVKLGLANLAVLLALYRYGWKEALMLNIMRVFLSGFLFGNLFVIMYSLAGAVCSFLVMCLFKRMKNFSLMGVSMAGGVFHNIGQILVAYFVTKTAGVVFYLPILLGAGMATGLMIGLIAGNVMKYLGKGKAEER